MQGSAKINGRIDIWDHLSKTAHGQCLLDHTSYNEPLIRRHTMNVLLSNKITSVIRPQTSATIITLAIPV